MEVRIVAKVKKNDVFFTNGELLNKNKKHLQYKKNDVVFVEKDDNGKLQIKEHHLYNELMQLIRSEKFSKEKMNKNLKINKFTNVFNLEKEYLQNKDEKEELEQIKKNNKLIEANLECRFDFLKIPALANDKLIIGLGNHSVFETDITLHWTYGIPYIPGSALKGVLRNYIVKEYFEECEENAKKDCLFVKIFGGERSRGNVIFMDAFPQNGYMMKTDIMTPHHSNYYSGEALPLDNDEANPVPFLVVEKASNNKNLEFEINLAIDKTLSDEIIQNEKDISKEILKKYDNKRVSFFILDSILETLEFHGVGAKTSVGYGYFDFDKDKIEIIDKNEKAIKEKREKEKLEKQEKKAKEELAKKKKREKEELEKKKKAEEKRFKEATKDMSKFEIEIYKIEQIEDELKKNEDIIELYNKIDKLDNDERIQLAKYMKKKLEIADKWKIKNRKNNKKKNRIEKRIEKICEILNIELPIDSK